MVSGAEIESSGMDFLVEMVAVSAAAAQPQANELPGSFRKAEIEGLLPSTMYEITLHGLMEGRRSVPLRVFTATGTPNRTITLIMYLVSLLMLPVLGLEAI
uniref:Fibronectin type-III domain-containing protein n=1 Tax=Xiphophorus couchianus TaxID=32473 RepID=A0A3B5MHH8_9TELE